MAKPVSQVYLCNLRGLGGHHLEKGQASPVFAPLTPTPPTRSPCSRGGPLGLPQSPAPSPPGPGRGTQASCSPINDSDREPHHA